MHDCFLVYCGFSLTKKDDSNVYSYSFLGAESENHTKNDLCPVVYAVYQYLG